MDYSKFALNTVMTGVGFVGSALIPQYVLPLIKVQNTGVAKYASEIVSGAALGFVAKLLKQDLEAPIWIGTGVLVIVQLAADILNMTNTFNVKGYGYLPAANGTPAISGYNYGALPGAVNPAMYNNNAMVSASNAYA